MYSYDKYQSNGRNYYDCNMNTFGQRAKARRIELGFSQADLAKKSGVSQSTIAQIESGRNAGSKHVVPLADALLVSVRWLADGTGDVGSGSNPSAPPVAVDVVGNFQTLPVTRETGGPAPGYVRLRIFDAHACMGAGGEPIDFPEVLQYVDVLRDYIVTELRCNPDHIDLLPTRGDSMKGTIEHGDIAFVDRTARSFDGDGIYVIVWGNGLMIKRLQALPFGGLSIISDNEKYKPMDVTPEQAEGLTICGRVTGKWAVSRI